MPARVVRAEINSSRSLTRVSLSADLTFRALIVAVDDFGRFEADPLMLKAALFPRRLEVTPEQVRTWVGELAADGCVLLYTVEGVEYLALTGWETHRGRTKRAKESRYPGPPGSFREPPGRSLRESESESGEGVDTRESESGVGDYQEADSDERMAAREEEEQTDPSGEQPRPAGRRATKARSPAPPRGSVSDGRAPTAAGAIVDGMVRSIGLKRRSPPELVAMVQERLGDREAANGALREVCDRLPEAELERLLDDVRTRQKDGARITKPVAYFITAARERIGQIDAAACSKTRRE